MTTRNGLKRHPLFYRHPHPRPDADRFSRNLSFFLNPGQLQRDGYGRGILRIRFSHSSASEASQISTSSFNGLTNGQVLRHEKHAWAGTASLKEIAKVPRHGLEIVRDENVRLCWRPGFCR